MDKDLENKRHLLTCLIVLCNCRYVLVCLECCNGLPQGNLTTAIYFLTVPEAKSPRSRCQHVWFVVETSLPGYRWLSSCWVSQMAQQVKNPPARQETQERCAGLIPGSGRLSGEGNGNPLQDSCLENSIDRGPGRAAVYGVTKSQCNLAHTVPSCYLLTSLFLSAVSSPGVPCFTYRHHSLEIKAPAL